jgi:hypothetical protein
MWRRLDCSERCVPYDPMGELVLVVISFDGGLRVQFLVHVPPLKLTLELFLTDSMNFGCIAFERATFYSALPSCKRLLPLKFNPYPHHFRKMRIALGWAQSL